MILVYGIIAALGIFANRRIIGRITTFLEAFSKDILAYLAFLCFAEVRKQDNVIMVICTLLGSDHNEVCFICQDGFP